MKKFYLFVLLTTIAFIGCNDSINNDLLNPETTINKKVEGFPRLNLINDSYLAECIERGDFLQTRASNPNFISLMDEASFEYKTRSGENGSYYETLGYDTLIPNPNFARLVNPDGEFLLTDRIIKITPTGTYQYPITAEEEFKYLEKTGNLSVQEELSDNSFKISDDIILYKTFLEEQDHYDFISDDTNEQLIEDDYIENENANSYPTNTNNSIPEPNYDSFQTFQADRKTVVGKLIQKIIGSSKTSSVYFNNKRRLRGSFYFYNYGVYQEIGVTGWTDKKNWIGWSKTKSDELRVGWNRVVVERKVPDFFQQTFDNLQKLKPTMPPNGPTLPKYTQTIHYFAPINTKIQGTFQNLATIVISEEDFKKEGLKEKVIKQGAKPLFDLIKKELKRPQSEVDKATAIIVATRTKIYYISPVEEVVKYNDKQFNHVFANAWMDFQVGWSNTNGWFINGINQNNMTQGNTYLKELINAFNDKNSVKLLSGEVHVCARFGNTWKGMRIVKKDEL